MFHLRPYQTNIIDKTRSLFNQGEKSVLVQLPTGGGKTLLTATMLATAANKGYRSWFIVHRRELVKQTILAFSNLGIKNFGVISSGFPEAKGFPIQICSIQTLIRRHKNYKHPQFIAFDECHHQAAGSWAKIYDTYSEAFHVGLTATPQRLDGSGLRRFFKQMVNGPSVASLIADGYLSNYKLFAPNKLNLSNVHMQMGDFKKSEITDIMDTPSITGDAIAHYHKHGKDKRAVVFCVSVEHSKHVVQKFIQSGVSAEHVDGETDMQTRDAAIKKFQSGETKVLSNVDLFGEGFDLPAIEMAILLRPTASLGLYLQQVGRALRPHPGKTHAIILDHVGNCQRHGLPDDDREWSLDGREKKTTKSETASVKVCPSCYAAQFAGSKTCKHCGYQYDVISREIEQRDGQLEEVDVKELRRIKLIAQGRAKSKEALIEEGKRRGYKHPERWAHYVWQARQARLVNGKG